MGGVSEAELDEYRRKTNSRERPCGQVFLERMNLYIKTDGWQTWITARAKPACITISHRTSPSSKYTLTHIHSMASHFQQQGQEGMAVELSFLMRV